ncbi:MAG: hypothetical protein J0L99_13155 [Chitinophagales bacterium]|nr:hypothetical protein [Chitinophagales bacterium]
MEQYDSMVARDTNAAYKKLTNIEMMKKEIAFVEEEDILKMLTDSENNSSIKNWRNVYIVYHFLSGEVNYSMTSIIYFRNKKFFGTTYSHNNLKKYKVVSVSEITLTNIKNVLHSGNDGLVIISKFDRNYVNLSNTIVAGKSYSNELGPLMNIYNEEIFD